MRRSLSVGDLIPFDSEIEKTLRKIRQAKRQQAEPSEHSDPLFSVSGNTGNMGDQNRTLREFTAPDFTQQPLAITYPRLDNDFELKGYMVHALPKFHGLSGEDPHQHLKKLHMVCSGMRPNGVEVDDVKLRAFPFSLEGAAENWFFNLPDGIVNSWTGMKRLFLERYFPASRVASIRKEISGIRQLDETLHEYWERFKLLCASCPNHQIPEQLLLQYFYEGLVPADRCMIDAASGGALLDKTLAEARALIENMAANFQQFGSRAATTTRGLHEVSHPENPMLTQTLQQLSGLMQQLMVSQAATPVVPKVCGICTSNEHHTDMCPALQDDSTTGVAATYPFQSQPQNQAGQFPFGNTYNSSWKNHPNLKWGNNSQQQGQSSQQKYLAPHQRQPALPAPPSSDPTMTEMMKMMMEQMQEIRKENAQLREEMTQLKQNQSQQAPATQLPSQTVPNPRGNVCAITLRSGTKIPERTGPAEEEEQEKTEQEKVSVERHSAQTPLQSSTEPTQVPDVTPPLPFPQRMQPRKVTAADLDSNTLEIFRKVQVNIPLLDAIKQIPKYAKFLKDLCTNKRKIKGSGEDKVTMGVNASSIIKPSNLPTKCKDPGSFYIPCSIGNLHITKALADLGAGINVMPKSLYQSLHFGELKPTGLQIQLANRSITKPEGVLEDVLVQVNDLIFPADFYVLEMENDTNANQHTLILGRPFLKTAKTMIDVHAGTLSMECGDMKVQFNLFDAMKHPYEEHSVFGIDVIGSLVDDACGNMLCKDPDPPFSTFSSSMGYDVPVVLECPKFSDTGTLLSEHSSVCQVLHNQPMLGKKPYEGQWILLHEPRAKLMVEGPKPRWKGPFLVNHVHPDGAIELENSRMVRCTIDEHQLMYLHETPTDLRAQIAYLWVEAPHPP